MTNFLQPIRNLFKGNNELALQPESAKELNALVNLDVFRAMPDQREPIRVFLDDHGYVEAGVNQGSPEALKNGLNHIVSGKYVDENMNEAKHTDYIERMRMLREDIRAKKVKPETELNHLIQHILPALQKDIRHREEQLAAIDMNTEELVQQSGYSAFKFWMYVIVFGGLTAFIYLFYSSAIYSAFYRDLNAEMAVSQAANDFSSLFNAVLNPFALSSGIPAVYIGPFFFFALALVWSYLQNRLKEKQGYAKWTGLTLFTFFLILAIGADFIIAWKIEAFSHELKQMNCLAEVDYAFYTEFMFWGVFILGLGAYVSWKLLCEIIVQEHEKKNPQRLAVLEKEKQERHIRLMQNEVLKVRQDEAELRRVLLEINHELNKVDILLERSYKGIGDIEHSLDAYYRGWIRYVSNNPREEVLLPRCEEVYRQYRQAFQAWQPIKENHFMIN